MKHTFKLDVTPEQNGEPDLLLEAVAIFLEEREKNISHIKVNKRSLDARKRPIRYILDLEVWVNERAPVFDTPEPDYPSTAGKPTALIAGAGPAGMFAALELIKLGVKPILLERGKDVRARRRDLAAINKTHVVNPDSNYCFGEGGAGTYSDGKLYTRSRKRGDVNKVLEVLVSHGAPQRILVDSHPHIGTNKLPQIITSMRESILEAGGEILFNKRVTDFIIHNNHIQGVHCADGSAYEADSLILATGHSARDIFELLYAKGIRIESKPFALGVRIEHPQDIIDRAQYKCAERGPYLPPASYKLVQQVKGRGVYSFCMCPGGIIAPCATGSEEVVTNGWSPSKRNNPFANSGIVVSIEEKDIQAFKQHGPLAGLRFQQSVERKAWIAGGKTQVVPAQRMVDFIKHKTSADLPASSYIPGITSVNLNDVLPKFVHQSLRGGLSAFGQKMRSYYTNEAVLHAVESRTSSPVRIPRDKQSLEHVEIGGLYPCGEGAGYAGGIVSAAIDGQRCAQAIAARVSPSGHTSE